MFVFSRWVAVQSIYTLIASTGQHASFGMLGIIMDFKGPLCYAFLGLSYVNLILCLKMLLTAYQLSIVPKPLGENLVPTKPLSCELEPGVAVIAQS
jgi:hypothetical protein